MTLTCMIVDDEPLAVKLIESFVQKTPDLELLGSFTDSVEAIGALKARPADLLFLDIQMPDMNGMELARMLPPQTKVVFTTAFKEYAFESYEVSALDFLLKPIRYNKFIAAVEKARERKSLELRVDSGQWTVDSGQLTVDSYDYPSSAGSSADMKGVQGNHNCQLSTVNSQLYTLNSQLSTLNSTLFIKVDGEYRQIQLSQVLYVAGMKDYVMFYLDGVMRPLVTHLTMKAVEEMLPKGQFLRIHRSYIVAVDKIRKIDRNDCVYIGDEIIHVPEGYQAAFRAFLESRTFNKL